MTLNKTKQMLKRRKDELSLALAVLTVIGIDHTQLRTFQLKDIQLKTRVTKKSRRKIGFSALFMVTET